MPSSVNAEISVAWISLKFKKKKVHCVNCHSGFCDLQREYKYAVLEHYLITHYFTLLIVGLVM